MDRVLHYSLSICLSVCVCVSIRPTVCLSTCLTAGPFTRLPVSLLVGLPGCLPTCVSACMSACQSVCVCLRVHPSSMKGGDEEGARCPSPRGRGDERGGLGIDEPQGTRTVRMMDLGSGRNQ